MLLINGHQWKYYFCLQNVIVKKPTNWALTIQTSQTWTPWIPMVIALGQQFISQQGVAPL